MRRASILRFSAGSLVLTLALAGGAGAYAAVWKVDEAASSLEFTAVGKPGFLRINGKGAKIKGSATAVDKGLQGSFETRLDDFETGIELRDEHMKKNYLETAKFPTAALAWTTAVGPKEASGEVPFKGKLKLHGVEKDVAGTARMETEGKAVDVEATFTIKLSEYGIGVPRYLGVTVAEDVEVHARIHAVGSP